MITIRPTAPMITATSRLDTMNPMMIAAATVATISAPITNRTSAGKSVGRSGASAFASLMPRLRAVP